jgi:CDGSH-type Zn-finger protein/truncated hemoglobin YjbI
MSNGDETSAGTPDAGQGKLAQLIATRGGKASPEAPFVIEHREALIYMLCEAAELEHGIMCQYLFAVFSLKQGADEGLSETELAAVTRWRKVISQVAAQEMLHLALVHNVLSAIGAAPHLARPNLPQPAGHYPAGVQLALLPFGEQALAHFMYLERPEGMDLDDADGLAAMGRAAPLLSDRDIVPRGQDFATVGHLYRSIEHGIAHLAAKNGERWLFVGPPRAQATQAHFRWPELVAVTDLASAQRAIDTILEQGEGPRGDWRNAHFGRFVEILDEYHQMLADNPGFDPVRPVIAACVRPPERVVELPLITDLLTARVTDLFNVAYEILLQIFERYFAHTQETDEQLAVLAGATIRLMLGVIKPLGDLITLLPAGPGHPGKTAGPSFELFYETDYLMPHREAAWALLTERLQEAAWLCEAIRTGRGAQIADLLAPVGAALTGIAGTLAEHLPVGSAHARPPDAAEPGHADLGELRARAGELAGTVAGLRRDRDLTDGLAVLFHAAYQAVTSADSPVLQAVTTPRLVDSVLRPLAGALARLQAEQDPAAAGNRGAAEGGRAGRAGVAQTAGVASGRAAAKTTGNGTGPLDAQIWTAAQTATRLRASLGATGAAPPELIEATAALQDLACRIAPAAQAEARLAQLRELQRGLPAMIQPAVNGPYLATNVPRLLNHLGEQISATPQLALCRCGGSAIKPFCDGTHARTGFTDAKDRGRVADRRDTYPGQQLTIFDNRGLCQHSGFCTDRLASVFRSGAEPFVAPSGGRMDEIIRAVRDCPSGALSYAVDGREAREQADWGNTRDPAIEVTKDGPYRITGGIALGAADGGDVARNAGASAEHFALCRCGQSQNKPFCSGMHWYVQFSDPAPSGEPTLYEWAGGLPGLTRMTRLLYEKHVPADPLLAPLFAGMAAGHPQREALWLAEVFGGPDSFSKARGGSEQLAAGHSGMAFTEQQRARWVALAVQAAQEAGLPGDPAFRSALVSYLEWGSAAAVAQSQPGAVQPPDMPVPHWDWGAAGPPEMPSAAPGDDSDSDPVTLPGPGEQVSFAAHIRPLFRERDRRSMEFAFDLWSVDDVRAHASDILDRVRSGSMPCDAAWSQDKVLVFQRWTESGLQP